SYRELAERAACLAAALRARFKLAPGDRIALTLTNCPQYVELMFAAWHAGLIVVPVNAKLHPREFHYILEHSGARLCFVTIGLASTIAPLAALPGLDAIIDVESREYSELLRTEPLEIVHRSPDDIAWLFYTSGTTGRPKGAMLTHRNLLAMTTSYFIDVDTVAPGDAILHAAPMSHGSGAYILPNVAAGAAQVIPESGHFDPAEIFALIAAHRGVSFFAAPTMVKRLVESTSASHADTAHLKTIVYGGGPMYVQDCKHAMEVLGNRLAQIYGQGECPMTITALSKARHAQRSHPRYLERLGSVGTAHTVVEVRVADRDDRSLPAGETGEVLVRGDPVMRGYWQDAEASAHALRGGWLHTGDVGVLDQDGFLTLKDRSKDLIISGGANIYPREVEETLLLHPAVTEASVVGAPHAEWGEEVVAFVVRRPDAWLDEAALDALCLEYIARFKRPKRYVFVDALPKNNYGKVLKSVLREQLSRSQAQQ
ncbi:MAG TPA: AMP-binding protein, partial [Burkholderiales bacterium]|nr:AMP-binding protein [Burkholderiales bacterium]